MGWLGLRRLNRSVRDRFPSARGFAARRENCLLHMIGDTNDSSVNVIISVVVVKDRISVAMPFVFDVWPFKTPQELLAISGFCHVHKAETNGCILPDCQLLSIEKSMLYEGVGRHVSMMFPFCQATKNRIQGRVPSRF